MAKFGPDLALWGPRRGSGPKILCTLLLWNYSLQRPHYGLIWLGIWSSCAWPSLVPTLHSEAPEGGMVQKSCAHYSSGTIHSRDLIMVSYGWVYGLVVHVQVWSSPDSMGPQKGAWSKNLVRATPLELFTPETSLWSHMVGYMV